MIFVFHVLSVSRGTVDGVQLLNKAGVFFAILICVVGEWAEFCLQFAVPAHLGLNLLIQVYSTLIETNCRWPRTLRHRTSLVRITYAYWLFEGAFASSVLLCHEA